MKYLLLFSTIFIGINCSADIVGKAKITDGDTIVINDVRIRFTGSDAPESYFFGKTQTCLDAEGQEWECGKAATVKLKELVNNQEVRCSDEGKDRYGKNSRHLLCGGNRSSGRDGKIWNGGRIFKIFQKIRRRTKFCQEDQSRDVEWRISRA